MDIFIMYRYCDETFNIIMPPSVDMNSSMKGKIPKGEKKNCKHPSCDIKTMACLCYSPTTYAKNSVSLYNIKMATSHPKEDNKNLLQKYVAKSVINNK